MKTGKMGHVFVFFALAILICSPFVFAGFTDWWTKITGRVAEDTVSVSLTVSGGAPVICSTASISAQDPTEFSTATVEFNFTACDPDGYLNIRDTYANATFFLPGYGTNRTNSSCEFITGSNNGTGANSGIIVNCQVTFQYFDDASTSWQAVVSVDDVDGVRGWATPTFTINTLNSMTITDTTLTFTGVTALETLNIESDNDMTWNNGGNIDLQLNVTAYNLDKDGNEASIIYANNFSIDDDSDGSGCEDFNSLVNATSVNITGAVLPNSNGATDEIGVCLEGVLPTIEAGNYQDNKDWIFATLPGA